MKDLVLLRLLFVALLACAAWSLRPFGAPTPYIAAAIGVVIGLVVVLCELKVRKITLKRLIGAALGSLLGLAGAYISCLILNHAVLMVDPKGSASIGFIEILLALVMGYVGLAVGASKGEMLNLGAFGGIFGGESQVEQAFKILDTSVIIDGRIADIVETGFIEGALVIPQFVLRELQLVADSADSLKRNRGRRGLDILQRIQKLTHLNVQILEDDFPNVREVDMKLIELAKVYNCKIVTNDFNLNKVAGLHGVDVLNINELANALKPIVLPGEIMRVFILKEGKEYNQGVAYLDDGTMVVVDNAKKMISRTIDISVTSVLQTTAGKMIFGRFDDRVHSVHDKAPAERHDKAREGATVGAHAEAKGSGSPG